MTEPKRRTSWSVFADQWDPADPALTRMRDALALPPTSEPAQEAPQRPEAVGVGAYTVDEPAVRPDDPKRGRIGELVARVQAGDLSAVDMLRRLIDR